MEMESGSESLRGLYRRMYKGLSQSGTIQNVKALVRGSVIEQLTSSGKLPRVDRNRTMKSRVVNMIVAEYLQSSKMSLTHSVFVPECGIPQADVNYESICEDEVEKLLGVEIPSGNGPTLLRILEVASKKHPTLSSEGTQTTCGQSTEVLSRRFAEIDVEVKRKEEFEGKTRPSPTEWMARVQMETEQRMQTQLKAEIDRFKREEVSRIRCEERATAVSEMERERKSVEARSAERLARERKVLWSDVERERERLLSEMESFDTKKRNITAQEETVRKRIEYLDERESKFPSQESEGVQTDQEENHEEEWEMKVNDCEKENEGLKHRIRELEEEAAVMQEKYESLTTTLVNMKKEEPEMRNVSVMTETNVCVSSTQTEVIKKTNAEKELSECKEKCSQLEREVGLRMKELAEMSEIMKRTRTELKSSVEHVKLLESGTRRERSKGYISDTPQTMEGSKRHEEERDSGSAVLEETATKPVELEEKVHKPIEKGHELEEKKYEFIEKEHELEEKKYEPIEKKYEAIEKEHEFEEKKYEPIEKEHEFEEKKYESIEKEHEFEEKKYEPIEKEHELEEKKYEPIEKEHELEEKGGEQREIVDEGSLQIEETEEKIDEPVEDVPETKDEEVTPHKGTGVIMDVSPVHSPDFDDDKESFEVDTEESEGGWDVGNGSPTDDVDYF